MLQAADHGTELGGAFEALRRETALPVRLFAYPFGGPHDETTLEIPRRAGFLAACTVSPTPVTSESNPLELPRLEAKPWAPAEFAEILDRLMAD